MRKKRYLYSKTLRESRVKYSRSVVAKVSAKKEEFKLGQSLSIDSSSNSEEDTGVGKTGLISGPHPKAPNSKKKLK